MKKPRESPLDRIPAVTASTDVLRDFAGALSVIRVARVYGVICGQLSRWLGAQSKTVLEYFERVARLVTVLSEAEFRQWLRTPNPNLGQDTPLAWLERRRWQALAHFVDDMLTGAST